MEYDIGEIKRVWDEEYEFGDHLVSWLISEHDRLTAENAELERDNMQLRLDAGVVIPKSVRYRHMEEKLAKTTAANARMREALEHVESQLYIDDYGDYGLLTTFDADMVRHTLKEAE